MSSTIVPISDFIRKFGVYAEMLADIDELVLTRDSRPFATIRATPEEKNRKMLAMAGIWKGSPLGSKIFWKPVLKRKNKTFATFPV